MAHLQSTQIIPFSLNLQVNKWQSSFWYRVCKKQIILHQLALKYENVIKCDFRPKINTIYTEKFPLSQANLNK